MRKKILLTCAALFQMWVSFAGIDPSTKTLIIEEGTTVIPANSYKNNTQFTSIQFPSTLERIGESAFTGCDSLETVVLPEGVYVEQYAFQSCKGLKKVVFSDNVKAERRSFRYCTAIDSILLAENDSLGYGVFEDITPIQKVIIPSSTQVDMWGIPSDTTYYMGSIEDLFNKLIFFYKKTVLYVDNKKMGNEIVVPDYVTEMSYEKICALKEVFSTITVNPQTLKKIENECEVDTVNYLGTLAQYNEQPIRAEVVLFNGKRLGGIVPEGIDSLGYDAAHQVIYDETKTKIVLPSSLKHMERVVSPKDTVLNIISFAEEPPVLESNYYMEQFDVRVYVPCQSVSAYQNDKMWSVAKSIKCLSDTTEIVIPVINDTTVIDTTMIDTTVIDTTAIDTIAHIHDFTYGDCSCGVVDSVEQHWFDISTVEELYQFASLVNEGHKWLNGRLLEDIVLNDTILHRPVEYNRNREIFGDTSALRKWTPIKKFSAVFDGKNHVIKGLYHERFPGEWDGSYSFINAMEGGTVRNLAIEDAFLYNNWEGEAAIICANASDSYFENCHVSGYVGVLYGSAAGLAGNALNCTFVNCYNQASVYGQNAVAGIAFVSYGSQGRTDYRLTIKKCWNEGEITGNPRTESVAGIAVTQTGQVDIQDCYNVGTVTSTANANEKYGAGGICGGNMQNVRISDCFNVGEVFSTGYLGAIAPILNKKISDVSAHMDSADFKNDTICIHNCYVLIGSAQGELQGDSASTEIHMMTADQFASGEVCYGLNHGVTDGSQSFYQNLKDVTLRTGGNANVNIPSLDTTLRTVAFDGTVYYNMKPEEVGEKILTSGRGVSIVSTTDGIVVENAAGMIRLADINGRVLFTQKAENEQSVAISISNKGVYLLSIDKETYKFIVR